MKKLSTTLAFLSFLFAIAAVVIALLGTISLRQDAQNFASEIEEELIELDEKTEETSALPEGYELSENMDPMSVTPEELGFTFLAPNEWGAFNLELKPGPFENSGLYSGSFENIEISYSSTIPEVVPGRGGYYADILGWREANDGYEVDFLNKHWSVVPNDIVSGTLDTINSEVLVINAIDPDEMEMSVYPTEEGSRMAVINIENGPVSGGVFIASAEVTRDQFREFLESLELVEKVETEKVAEETTEE